MKELGKRGEVTIASGIKEYLQLPSRPSFKSPKMFNSNL